MSGSGPWESLPHSIVAHGFQLYFDFLSFLLSLAISEGSIGNPSLRTFPSLALALGESSPFELSQSPLIHADSNFIFV